MSSLNLFNFSALKNFLAWKQGDEDEKWAEKAFDNLMKKLKKRKDAIEDLKRALANPGQPSNCVTIERSVDGRLQISHRKGLPHVIYCRLFRWPDLQSHHELRSLDCCKYPFSGGDRKDGEKEVGKAKDICINPFHYERLQDAVVLPPILVPRYSDFAEVKMEADASCYQPIPEPYWPQNYSFGSPNMSSNLAALSPTSQLSDISDASPIVSPRTAESSSQQSAMEMDTESVPSDMQPVHYVEPESWCSIVYYELNTRVGEEFRVSSRVVTVDGFTDPTKREDRICLGLLSNVNRNASIEFTRQQVGRGVCISYRNGEVFAQCLSNYAIFVQSRNCNAVHGFHPTTVCKIPTGVSLKIFDSHAFCRLLNDSVLRGYEAVFDMTKMCTIRISFVRGWGAEYHRQDATSTPCWFELQLHGPLLWVDKVLQTMEGPNNKISSTS